MRKELEQCTIAEIIQAIAISRKCMTTANSDWVDEYSDITMRMLDVLYSRISRARVG